jgi:hypothetical protein
VHQEHRSIGWGSDDGGRSATLLRAEPTGFAAILDFESTWSRGEADRQTRCELVMGSRMTRGFFDAVVECVDLEGNWHDEDPDKNGETRTERRERYRWNGSTYEP